MEEGICTLSPNRLRAGGLPCFPISRQTFLTVNQGEILLTRPISLSFDRFVAFSEA